MIEAFDKLLVFPYIENDSVHSVHSVYCSPLAQSDAAIEQLIN